MKNIVCSLTKAEIDKCLAECNFTCRENELFLLRNEEKSLEECAEIMDYSVRTISTINKELNRKLLILHTSYEIGTG